MKPIENNRVVALDKLKQIEGVLGFELKENMTVREVLDETRKFIGNVTANCYKNHKKVGVDSPERKEFSNQEMNRVNKFVIEPNMEKVRQVWKMLEKELKKEEQLEPATVFVKQ